MALRPTGHCVDVDLSAVVDVACVSAVTGFSGTGRRTDSYTGADGEEC